jgi:hypothetical protein
MTKFTDAGIGLRPGAQGDVHDLMRLYYARLFPAKTMMKWLAYGNDSKQPQAGADTRSLLSST